MKRQLAILVIAAAGLAAGSNAMAAEKIAQFSGGIGVQVVGGIAAGAPTPNNVLGVPPGGRPWVIRKLRARIDADGTIKVEGAGLLFAGGDVIGTTGPVTAVKATLFCGGMGFDSPPADLDPAGDFKIRGRLVAVPPNPCVAPVLLIRALAGAWFAAGIPGDNDD